MWWIATITLILLFIYFVDLRIIKNGTADYEENNPWEDTTFSDKSIIKEELGKSIDVLGVSIVESVGARDKVSYGKRKLNKIYTTTKTKIAEVLDVNAEKLVSDEGADSCCEKSKDLDLLIM